MFDLNSYSPFCPKYRCHGNGGRSGEKWNWEHSMAHPENPPIGAYSDSGTEKISSTRQNLLH